MLLGDYEESEIESNMSYVKKYLHDMGIYVSMGLSYVEKYRDNFGEMKEIADKKMYEDKEQFYVTTGHPRRKV